MAGLSWALPLPSQQAARRRAARDARAPSRFLHAAPQFGIDNAKRSRCTNSDWEEKEAAEKQWHEDQTRIAVADSLSSFHSASSQPVLQREDGSSGVDVYVLEVLTTSHQQRMRNF